MSERVCDEFIPATVMHIIYVLGGPLRNRSFNSHPFLYALEYVIPLKLTRKAGVDLESRPGTWAVSLLLQGGQQNHQPHRRRRKGLVIP
jgi:hypothetical protein